MNKHDCILTIDAGTTSIKVSLFDTQLKLLHCSVQEYALDAKLGYIEVDAGVYLNAVCAGVSDVRRAVSPADIIAISVTTQGETLALFDDSGMPLTPFIVWLDARASEQAQALSQKLSAQSFYEQTGLPEIQGALPLAKMMWLRDNEPELYSRANKVMLLEDYLLFWFTGKIVSEKSIQTSTGWFNLNADTYWQEILDLAGIDAQKLPQLCESGTAVGKLTGTAARLLSLDEGITIVAGAMDQTAAALSAGCVCKGVVTETTGTALVMTACTDNPSFSAEHRVTIYRHAIKGLYLYLPIANTAGMALKWFRDTFCEEQSHEGYSAMDSLAKKATAGCNGLIFLPYLAGSVDPDACANATGVFFGATLATSKADFARSVFEAVGFMLKDFLQMLELLGIKPSQVLSLGGGSRSALWQQIKADICEAPFCSVQCSEAASQGAALLAMWGAGLLERGSAPQALSAISYLPCADTFAQYQKSYSLYKNLYNAVKPLYTQEANHEKS